MEKTYNTDITFELIHFPSPTHPSNYSPRSPEPPDNSTIQDHEFPFMTDNVSLHQAEPIQPENTHTILTRPHDTNSELITIHLLPEV